MYTSFENDKKEIFKQYYGKEKNCEKMGHDIVWHQNWSRIIILINIVTGMLIKDVVNLDLKWWI